MNYLRTAILLAGLTALFMAVGYLLGGGTGAVIALLFAAATNLFSYWNSDKLVLSMHDARRSTKRCAFPRLRSKTSRRSAIPQRLIHCRA